MIKKISRNDLRQKRHLRIRKNLVGTALRPRLSVYRSANHIYAQLIDDVNGVTLASASSNEKEKHKISEFKLQFHKQMLLLLFKITAKF